MQILIAGAPETICLNVTKDITFQEVAKTLASRLESHHDVWFQHGGRRCRERSSISSFGVTDGSTLQMHLRLRGGGGDGGATGAESRASYLEMYMQKKPDKINPAEEKLAKWTTCKLSGEPLQPPCVVDELGSLYNKEAMISALVSKTVPKALGHITSLKHIKDVKLTPISGGPKGPDSTAASLQPGNEACFQCPISGQPLNGQYRFCALLPTGHIVSEKAVKQVPSAVQELTGSAWDEARPLNGTKEEVEALWDRLIATRAAGKKSKKEKQKATVAVAAIANAGENMTAQGARPERKSSSEDSPTNSIERKLQPDGLKRPGVKRGVQDFSIREESQAKKMKVKEMAPAHSDKKVWASLFTSTHGQPSVETYSCRSTSGRGWM